MGGNDKTIAKCIFDLVNTSNPSGGLVSPGNSLWFHKLVLKIFGTIGPDYKKLIKNHACIHDACGFLMNHFKVGLGYVYGLFEENTLEISSAGKSRGHFDLTFSSLCWLIQLTGLRSTWELMNLQLSFTPSFNVYDSVEEIEGEILFKKMEDLSQEKTKRRLPSLMQYGVIHLELP